MSGRMWGVRPGTHGNRHRNAFWRRVRRTECLGIRSQALRFVPEVTVYGGRVREAWSPRRGDISPLLSPILP